MKTSEAIAAFLSNPQGLDSSLRQRLAWWSDEIGHHDLTSLDTDALEDAITRLMQRGKLRYVRNKGLVATGEPLSGATINRHRNSFGTFLKWCRKKRLVPRGWVSPLKEVEWHDEGEHNFRFLTAEEVKNVIAAARVARYKRLPLAIMLAFTTGVRKGNLAALRWRDIDIEQRRISFARTKNGKPFTAVFPAYVGDEMKRIRDRHPDALVFCKPGKEQEPHDWRKGWEAALKTAGLPYINWHGLRHSCASHAATKGASVVRLADMLNHKTMRMVQRYAHLTVDERQRFVDEVFV